MAAPLPLTLQSILEVANESALNTGLLQSRMHDSDIRRHLMRIKEMAEKLGIQGTPAFVVNGHLLQGGIDNDRLRRFVATAVAGSVEN
jgi:2-hydroxychromene-2-carboxylate isomerase